MDEVFEEMCISCSDYVVFLVFGDRFNDSAPGTGVL
jgi:hypothetical protein